MAEAFAQFSSLPYELRAMIWRHTLAPRVVRLDIETEGPRSEPFRRGNIHLKQFQTVSLRASSKLPIAFSTCRESRRIALGCYKPHFRDEKTGRFAYFDPTVDTLFLKTTSSVRATYIFQFVDNVKRREFESVRYLAIETRSLEKYKGFNLTPPVALRDFTYCKSLAVLTVVGQWEGIWQQAIERSQQDFDQVLERELANLSATYTEWRKPQVRRIDHPSVLDATL